MMKLMKKWLGKCSLIVVALFSVSAPAKQLKVEPGDVSIILPSVKPGILVGADADTLSESHGLDAFFSELEKLRNGQDTIVNIVHLGDSHIQAGYYSGEIMRLMQAAFGCAGRGWIAPLKISKTNEPDDYVISSSIKKWSVGRCTQAKPRAPWGLGGMGLETTSPSVDFDVIVTPRNGRGYGFNKVVQYRAATSMPMLPASPYKEITAIHRDSSHLSMNFVADTFLLSQKTDTFTLHSTRRKIGSDVLLPSSEFRNVYYGFSLENGHRGVLYHAIGCNGGMFVNYTKEQFVWQLSLLKPSLLIISMGTNESFGRNFRTGEFSKQIESFLDLVKKYMPNTAILLTTPPECFKRKYVNKKRLYVRNSNIELVASTIKSVAEKQNLACWDLFTATGGKNSCEKWRDDGLMGKDYLHFTTEGYREQGKLLFRALMKEYMLSIYKNN